VTAIYGGVARLRRTWYENVTASRVRLDRPVISVGNLVTGGSGKTPVVAALAGVLTRLGHRPAILSRGYGRTGRSADVVVVSDGTRALVTVDESGDEPQMLARTISGIPVVVAAERARAGRLAIDRFDATVLILDDGFQHLQLVRTVDLLVLSNADFGEKLLPSGRLREPLSAARTADAVLVYGTAAEAGRVAGRAGVARSFFVIRRHLPLRTLHGLVPAGPVTLAAVAGIARPERFFEGLQVEGHSVVCKLTYRDHHWFTASDVNTIERRAQEHGAAAVVTTAKDGVRLERHAGVMTLPWAILPLEVSIEPGAEFESWLRRRL
jgi:tetraacyldisaccharide 4'-kinase